MILSLLSFPLPPALCTIFGERGLPCPVTSPCVSLSPCPVSSGLSLFVLPQGAAYNHEGLLSTSSSMMVVVVVVVVVVMMIFVNKKSRSKMHSATSENTLHHW